MNWQNVLGRWQRRFKASQQKLGQFKRFLFCISMHNFVQSGSDWTICSRKHVLRANFDGSYSDNALLEYTVSILAVSWPASFSVTLPTISWPPWSFRDTPGRPLTILTINWSFCRTVVLLTVNWSHLSYHGPFCLNGVPTTKFAIVSSFLSLSDSTKTF